MGQEGATWFSRAEVFPAKGKQRQKPWERNTHRVKKEGKGEGDRMSVRWPGVRSSRASFPGPARSLDFTLNEIVSYWRILSRIVARSKGGLLPLPNNSLKGKIKCILGGLHLPQGQETWGSFLYLQKNDQNYSRDITTMRNFIRNFLSSKTLNLGLNSIINEENIPITTKYS